MSITNLNKVRKARARTDRKTRAAQNAVAFGRTKAEKALDKAKLDHASSKLNDHKRT